VSFIVFRFLITLSSITIIKICLFHRLDLPKHTNLWGHEGPLYYQTFVLTVGVSRPGGPRADE
jgi:hypothetical protein